MIIFCISKQRNTLKTVVSHLEISFGGILDSPGYKPGLYFVISKELQQDRKQIPKKADVIYILKNHWILLIYCNELIK